MACADPACGLPTTQFTPATATAPLTPLCHVHTATRVQYRHPLITPRRQLKGRRPKPPCCRDSSAALRDVPGHKSAGLPHLQLFRIDRQETNGSTLAVLPAAVLASMAHLTCLALSFVDVESLHPISALSSLSVLDINNVRGPRGEGVRLAPNTSQGFTLPATLHTISLRKSVYIDPALLSSCAQQLTRLELDEGSVVQGGVLGGSALLSALAEMQELQVLALVGPLVHWPPSPAAAYKALTSSSKLQSLVLYCVMPEGAWEAVFGHPVSSLTSLELGYVSAREVSTVVVCCPRLLDLSLRLRTDTTQALVALKPLSSLTRLRLALDVDLGRSYHHPD